MMKKQELMQRAAVLRQYEVFGYQVAYYLLEDEALAREAAAGALAELLKDDAFYRHPCATQRQLAKQLCMKHSLRAKANSLQQVV